MNNTRTSASDVSSAADLPTPGVAADEINLTDILVAVGEGKYYVFCSALIALLLGVLLSFLLTPAYIAKTVVMPPQQQQTGIGALAGLTGLPGLGNAIGVKTPDDMYVGLLQSETVANDLIARFKLTERYHVKLASQARTILGGKAHIAGDKRSGFITITVSDRSPTFAAELANAYVDQLRKMLDVVAVTDAQQRRVFFQREIDKTLTRLSEAQLAFDQAQKRSGVVSLDEQVSSSIRASAELRARIQAHEVQLQSMRTYATEENPDVQRVLAEIQAMQSQLNTLEQGSGAAAAPVGDSAAMANIRAYREVKYQEALLDQFRKQIELAQMDEAREGPLVQQIDKALPPDRRSSPKRALIALAAGGVGGLIGLVIALLRAALRSETPFSNDLRRIRQAWALGRSGRKDV